MTLENQVEELLQDFEKLKNLLTRKAAEIHQRELLKDIDHAAQIGNVAQLFLCRRNSDLREAEKLLSLVKITKS